MKVYIGTDLEGVAGVVSFENQAYADGNLNHTQNSRAIDYYKLNDKLIGEIAYR